MKITIRNQAAFMGVWTALQQYLDNHDDCVIDAETQVRMDEVQALVDQFDVTMMRAADLPEVPAYGEQS